MQQFLSSRVLIFLIIFLALSLLESFYSFHSKTNYYPFKRKILNLLVFMLGAILTKLCQPVVLLFFSQKFIFEYNFASLMPFSHIINNIFLLLLFDLVIYWQHRLFHRVNWLWRFHSLHHEDYDLDVTSALRFHPYEIVISLMFKMVMIYLTGISYEYYLVFEILLNSLAMFNHANIKIPQLIEVWLGKIVMTPRLHLLHHFQDKKCIQLNFGFSLTLWDYLFNTFSSTTDEQIKNLNIGLCEERHDREKTIYFKKLLEKLLLGTTILF